MGKIPLSWIVNDPCVIQAFLRSIHRQRRLQKKLHSKTSSRLVSVNWVSNEENLFDRFLMTMRRRRIQLQRLVKGLIEKPNEDAGVFLSTSNYSRCLANKWCLIQAKMKQMYSNLLNYCEIKQAVVLFDYFIFWTDWHTWTLFPAWERERRAPFPDFCCIGRFARVPVGRAPAPEVADPGFCLGGPRVGVEAPLAPGPASGVFLAESQQFPDCQSFETFFELRGCVVTALLNG